MSVSIKDVAKKCGLSVSTVSRALNNQYGVSQKAINLAQQAAKELGYVPDLNAKDLVSKKSNLVGLIIPETDFEARPAFFELLPYISKTLALFQKELIISPVTPISNGYESHTLESIIRKRKLDGCIILPGFASSHPIYKDAKKLNYPIVTVGEDIISRTCSNIKLDDQQGAFLAVQHLIEKGHTKIGFINGPRHASICLERLEGYQKAMKDAGLVWDDEWIIESDFTREGGAKSIDALVASSPSLTACFFANDLMAIGGISKLTSLGIRIPADFSIIGFDDILLSNYTIPPLSTITMDNKHLGIRIAELLLQLINGGTGRFERLVPTLVPRDSVQRIE